MTRIESWPEALYEHVESKRDVPFSWGTHDCSTFAAGAVEAMTGETVTLPVVESAAAYVAYLAEHGPLADLVTAELGDPLPSPAFAQRGDVVIVDMDGRESLAVCLGVEAIGPSADGLLAVPMTTASAAWRV